MTIPPRSQTWFRLSVCYFAAAVALGIVMGASGDHSLMAVHAHLNLLGWVSMALFGLLGIACPATLDGRLAAVQFWLYNLGTPVMLAALAARIRGQVGAEPVIGAASVVVGIAVALFAWNVLSRIGGRSPTTGRAAPPA